MFLRQSVSSVLAGDEGIRWLLSVRGLGFGVAILEHSSASNRNLSYTLEPKLI